MRTKTLLLAAAVTAAGIASMQAQSNVYSINVVGYYNVVVPANNPAIPSSNFRIVANQLKAAVETLDGVITASGGARSGETVALTWKADGTGYETFEFDDGSNPKWTNPGNAQKPFAVGAAAFIRNDTVGSPLTLTFVGEVMQGNLVNPLTGTTLAARDTTGTSLKGSMVPQAGSLIGVLQYPVAADDVVLTWKAGSPGGFGAPYEADPPNYVPAIPDLEVGQGFFSRRAGPGNWTRSFTVQ